MSIVPYAGGSGGAVSHPAPVLTGDNYTTWAIKVEADLDAAGVWEAVVPPKDAASAVIAKKDKPARAYLLRAPTTFCCRWLRRGRQRRYGRA